MVDFWRGEFIFFKTRLKFLSDRAGRLIRSEHFSIGTEVAFCVGQRVSVEPLKAAKRAKCRAAIALHWLYRSSL